MSVCICLSLFTQQPRQNTRKQTKYLDLSLGILMKLMKLMEKNPKFDKLINNGRIIFRKPHNKNEVQCSFYEFGWFGYFVIKMVQMQRQNETHLSYFFFFAFYKYLCLCFSTYATTAIHIAQHLVSEHWVLAWTRASKVSCNCNCFKHVESSRKQPRYFDRRNCGLHTWSSYMIKRVTVHFRNAEI